MNNMPMAGSSLFLALGLFLKKWPGRPAPSNVTHEARANGWSAMAPPPFVLSALIAVMALMLLPVRVIYEINPDWPLMQEVMAALVVAFSLYAVCLMGGLGWVKYFAFPVCFILVAVQWPYRIEHGLTQGLMRVVANLTVEILGWCNIPAVQHGNLIEVSAGTVGVAEACSGIRSFQSTLMGGLFLGELYLLTWPRRLILVLSGVIVAFGFNVLRTLFLAWKASSEGVDAVEKWHDTAGMTIFLVSFGCLWLLAIWLRQGNSQTTDVGTQKADHRLPTTDDGSKAESGKQKAEIAPAAPIQPSAFSPQPLLRRYLIVIGCWAVLVFGLTQWWYRAHEIKDAGVFSWRVALPVAKPGFQAIELPRRAVKLLAFDAAATGSWPETDDSEWSLYYFRWNPTSASSIFRAREHRPDVCLKAAGLRQVEDGGVVRFAVGAFRLPFHRYVYESEGRILYVFFCEWEDSAREQTGLASTKQSGRVITALKGRRHLGQQTLELILSGYSSWIKPPARWRRTCPS